MGEERRYELQNPGHDCFGTFKQRPEAAHVKLIHPDLDESDLSSQQIKENWNYRYNHILDKNEKHPVACSRFTDPSAKDEIADLVPECDLEDKELQECTLHGTQAELSANSPSQSALGTDGQYKGKQVMVDKQGPGGERKRKLVSFESEDNHDRPAKLAAVDVFEGPSGIRDPSTASIQDPRLPIPPETRWHVSYDARVSRLDRQKGHVSLGSLVESAEIIYDPDPETTFIEEDRDMVDAYYITPGYATDLRQSKWVLRMVCKRSVLWLNGLTHMDVYYDILSSREDVCVIESNEEINHPDSIYRVRLTVDPDHVGEGKDDWETMARLKKFVKAKIIPIGEPASVGAIFPGKVFPKEVKTGEEAVKWMKEMDQEDAAPSKPSPILSHELSPWATKAAEAGTPLEPILTPLKLSTLASVTGHNRSRNKMVDVLAAVDSVDDFTVKRTNMPLKRDIRITDASTEKKVTLSIFTNPLDIIPTVGTIILFRNLITHDFKGGNLNAYPKQCDGKDWCIPNPYSSTPGSNLNLEETLNKIREDIDLGEGLKLSVENHQENLLHSNYSLKWPKQFQARQLRNANPADVKHIKTMQKWGLVEDPPVCAECGEPHREKPNEEEGCVMTGRVYGSYGEKICKRSGRVVEDDSD